jgi:holo-[acyl-carrier protein] synthase
MVPNPRRWTWKDPRVNVDESVFDEPVFDESDDSVFAKVASMVTVGRLPCMGTARSGAHGPIYSRPVTRRAADGAGSSPGFHVRAGLDLVDVDAVASCLIRHGARYTGRLFTDAEVADCPGPPQVAARGLAARFAAKEAVIKVLAPAQDPPRWRDIEVVRSSNGGCRLSLSGRAQALSVGAGIETWSASLTHEGHMAAAVVLATSTGSCS